ncbi:MAG: asparagine synthase (glutamine-hydrolyzing) [Gemmatimonadetes bacterium]|jgi:asparagine synthase (glutamine-hydrolysing)|nr:asparagine synthase (glutamine-hydrolyzing) [Gemmatimonadota bacterium]MBT5800171.1 asparagine synthase (glutamine-hydrolyzing) [Gemmatimonadota bacterium]MBT7587890.1 asparagine synthase (glutamine-hydrolyzing) [Gemmatimonadota bacterium]
MCGIAGVLGDRDRVVGANLLERLKEHLSHRGPDDEGMEVIDCTDGGRRALGLVHTRLAILDLSVAGHQPMCDAQSGNWISFNGEIYNFRAVRDRLESMGEIFTSTSDTEVILKAYHTWGLHCLQELDGMFALALWDQSAQRLLLAVDRLGVKPLYYYQGDDGLLLFGSELRALLATELIPRRIDPAGLEGYLAFGAVQAPRTIVRDVRCMQPGHYAVIDARGIMVQAKRYWTPAFVPAAEQGHSDTAQLARAVRAGLQESVEQHLVSDVPVGLFLSGGIDSSSLVALASRISSVPLQTFAVTFPEAGFSEAPYSRLIAQKYQTEHREICLDENQCLDLLPEALAAMDQPAFDGTNVFVVSRAVRETGLKVALSGQGGDELLTGYSTYRSIRTLMRCRPLLQLLPGPLREGLAGLWQKGSGRSALGHKFADLLRANDATALSPYLILRALFLQTARDNLLTTAAEDIREGLPVEVERELRDLGGRLDPINQVSLYELSTYLANVLLRDSDVMGMAHGLEIRVPFLHHRFVDLVAGMPGRDKYGTHGTKPLLLQAMGDLLPPEIYQRPKAGFTFPWEHWLRNQLRPQVARTLSAGDVSEGIGLDASFCRDIWQHFERGQSGITWSRVWGLFCLLTWCEKHRVRL